MTWIALADERADMFFCCNNYPSGERGEEDNRKGEGRKKGISAQSSLRMDFEFRNEQERD